MNIYSTPFFYKFGVFFLIGNKPLTFHGKMCIIYIKEAICNIANSFNALRAQICLRKPIIFYFRLLIMCDMRYIMKKKLITFLIIIALLIPTFIAVADYAYLKHTPLEYRNLSGLEITDLAGDRFVIDRTDGSAAEETLKFFVSLNKKSRAVDSLPAGFAEAPAFTFVYQSYSLSASYKYYFTQGSTDAYYSNSEGKVYKLSEEDARAFMCTSYARCLYDGAATPILSVADTKAVVPSTVTWTFRTMSGEYVSYDTSFNTTKAINTYEMSSNIGMHFSVEPDFFYITVTQNDTEIYKGDYADLIVPSSLNIETPVKVAVTAEWYESVDHVYAGRAEYLFEATLVPPPVFSLKLGSIDTVSDGSLIIIEGKNVRDTADITFSSSPEIGYTPVWYNDTETATVRALVPISIYKNYDSDQFIFSVTSGGTKNTMSVNYKGSNFSTLSELGEATLQSQIDTISDSIDSQYAQKIYFSGAFGHATGKHSSFKGFGRTVAGNYRHSGIDYSDASSGDEAQATAAGVISYIGQSDDLGAVVVIDHGLGLRSWYFKLSQAAPSLTVGTEVSKGDLIGYCNGMLHLSVTVFNQPISPYQLWSDGNPTILLFD